MTELNFVKVAQPKAALIASSLDLTDEAKALLMEDMTPANYIQRLTEQSLYMDAIMMLAAGLSKRESTWWACLCARNSLSGQLSETDTQAIKLAEAWVYKPSKENCQRTLPAAEATGFKTAAGWSAMAAFWSGDDISPNKNSIVPPPNDLTSKAVNGAILLAAAQAEPSKIAETQSLFIRIGIDIACGGDGRSVK
jgi:hypothetical protein